MVKTLILYESHSGFTEKIANQLALILGPSYCCKTTEFKRNPADYDFIVICTPGYAGIIDKSLLGYVTEHASLIRSERVVLLCTCLDEESAYQCLAPLRNLLGRSVIYSSSIQEDAETRLNRLALEIKMLRDETGSAMEASLLDRRIDEFILSHNTCALATGHENTVRVTPIEYIYRNRLFYFLSEGGEKFANLILNPTVSICIYNEYTGMNDLGGMQVSGKAEMVPIGSEEYLSVLEHKNISFEKLLSLPVAMNMIKVTVNKIEFLNSEFAKQGYRVKQIRIR